MAEDNTRQKNKYLQKEKRFFEALKEDRVNTALLILSDKLFKKYLSDRDKLSLAFVQVVLLNNVRLLQALVSEGLDLETTDSMFEENGVMHATRYGHKEMIEYLLENGVCINHQSQNGATALHVAVENAKYECLEWLVQQKGIDLNIQDRSGYSPLAWAVRRRDHRSMRILLEAGRSVDTRTFYYGATPLHLCVDLKSAIWKGKYAMPKDVCRCIELLVDAGSDINKGDISGDSPLVYAIKSNCIPALIRLLQMNCNLACLGTVRLLYQNDLTNDDPTLVPLFMAIESQQLRTVVILCQAGARYHKLARDTQILNMCERKCKHLKDWLHNQVYSVMTLREACRRTIRASIVGRIDLKVKHLQLPQSLEDYVSLTDLNNL